jgi:hypothetical protein
LRDLNHLNWIIIFQTYKINRRRDNQTFLLKKIHLPLHWLNKSVQMMKIIIIYYRSLVKAEEIFSFDIDFIMTHNK